MTFRLILWPTLITALVSAARLLGEVQQWIPPQSGGALNPLGISWLAFVFGGYFAYRLARANSHAIVQRAWLWALTAFVIVSVSIVWQFGPLAEAEQFRPFLEAQPSDETFERLRGAVLTLAAIATTLAVLMFAVWPRLAWTMLCYAVPARLLVVGFTWLAKHFEWTTHYTKFGPAGIERDMSETMLSATIAQGGFWVPWTILAGCMVGSFFAKRRVSND